MNEVMSGERLITVCSECKKASCWYWLFPCDAAQSTAGLIKLSLDELRLLDLEHPSYWTEDAVQEYTGVRE